MKRQSFCIEPLLPKSAELFSHIGDAALVKVWICLHHGFHCGTADFVPEHGQLAGKSNL
jgi:hypothetical protein